eukprot:7830451-Lingulodinium_polyedra.AAC.1
MHSQALRPRAGLDPSAGRQAAAGPRGAGPARQRGRGGLRHGHASLAPGAGRRHRARWPDR